MDASVDLMCIAAIARSTWAVRGSRTLGRGRVLVEEEATWSHLGGHLGESLVSR